MKGFVFVLVTSILWMFFVGSYVKPKLECSLERNHEAGNRENVYVRDCSAASRKAQGGTESKGYWIQWVQ
jgi:hypothetical protein